MRRIAATALTIGALLALSGCKTDNGPPVVAGPPAQPAADERPTAETLAWAGQMVGDALTAEKSARDAGKGEGDIRAAIGAAVNTDVIGYQNKGASTVQIVAGLNVALSDTRNTPTTRQIFQILEATFSAGPAGSSGHCTGCKGID